MLATKTIASALQGLDNVRIVTREYEPDDEIVFGENAPPAEDAEVVEGDSLCAIPVSDHGISGFTHFVDGAQKTRVAFYEGQMPGYLAFLNAAILRRVDGDMLESSNYSQVESIFVPEESQALGALAREEFHVTGVQCPEDAGLAGYRECVTSRISTARDELESTLKAQWLRDNESGWLLADGGIAQAAAAVPEALRMVGVVKSHRKQYFCSRVTAEVVLNLDAGERTSVFVARTGSMGRDVSYSWYLRLRDDRNESPVFGLVRVEMPPRRESLETASEVSSWLLAERSPLSLPDVRFDRMVYPIRRVEMFLKSRQHSDYALAARLGI